MMTKLPYGYQRPNGDMEANHGRDAGATMASAIGHRIETIFPPGTLGQPPKDSVRYWRGSSRGAACRSIQGVPAALEFQASPW